MKYPTSAVLVSCLLAGMSAQAAAENAITNPALKAEAVQIVQTFGGRLKPKLEAAIQSGGLVHAIDVCSVEAPKIAQSLSAQTGWDVKRVSLKARNKSSATPDDFEHMMLEKFNERQANGESAATLVFAGVVDDKYRFMKAQGTQGLCLNCHGAALQPQVKEALAEHYPDDIATGYSLGQVRGAFSLTKPM